MIDSTICAIVKSNLSNLPFYDIDDIPHLILSQIRVLFIKIDSIFEKIHFKLLWPLLSFSLCMWGCDLDFLRLRNSPFSKMAAFACRKMVLFAVASLFWRLRAESIIAIGPKSQRLASWPEPRSRLVNQRGMEARTQFLIKRRHLEQTLPVAQLLWEDEEDVSLLGVRCEIRRLIKARRRKNSEALS